MKASNTLETEVGTQASNESANNSELYRLAAGFTDLLIRHHEIVAVTAYDKDNLLHIAYDDSFESMTENPEGDFGGNVAYTHNLREDERSTPAIAFGR